MKKIIKLSLILLVISLIMLNASRVSAALVFNVSMQPEKANQNREVVVNVNLSNIQSQRGIMSFGATLEYDKDNLTLVKMEGQNGWETPIEGASYNPANGKIVMTRSGFAKNDETILKVTFQLKEGSKEAQAHLKNVSASDGTDLGKIDELTIKITETQTGNPTPTPTPSPDQTPSPSQNPTPSNTPETSPTPEPSPSQSPTPSVKPSTKPSTDEANKNENTVSGKLPQTGENNMIFIISGIVLIVAVAVFYVRYRMINKKIRK